ncbi:MAG: hypothetical protein M3Q61_03180, partial [Chloroflexota bacterium]|nr:hypothetical protein [Chloroflexota bacterium]
IGPAGARRRVDLACAWIGGTARHLQLDCGTSQAFSAVLFDPVSARRDAVGTPRLLAGSRAALWREGTQWWLGILAP